MRSDPSNSKRGDVCIYYGNFLHVGVSNFQYFHQCINIEVKIGDKLFHIIGFYRYPSKLQDVFEKSSEKNKLNLDSLFRKNIFFLVLIRDFHAKPIN